MIITLIIISIAFVFSLIGNIVLFRTLNILTNAIIDEQQLEQELAFISGENDIPEDEIAQKFLDATVLCRVEKNPNCQDVEQMIDVSNYPKNRLIGLTYFVRPQCFEELKESFDAGKIKERLYQKIVNRLYDDEDDIDEDFVNEALEQAMKEVLHNEYIINETTMTRPLLPHCTVYQLKNGRWVWRQEDV